MKRQLAFGLPLTGSGVAEAISTYGDNMLVARLYGPGVMGHYNLSFNVATTPNAYIAEYASEVMLPGLSAVREPERRRRAFLRAFALLPLLVFPLAFGLAVTAPTIVATLLDPRWASTGPMITILSGIAVARTIGTVTFPYLLSNGRSSTLLTLAVLRASALVALILTLGRLGPLWACAAATLAAVTAHFASLVAVSRSERIGVALVAGLPDAGAAGLHPDGARRRGHTLRAPSKALDLLGPARCRDRRRRYHLSDCGSYARAATSR